MPIGSHEVHPLFVEPCMRVKLTGVISPDQIAFIKGLKMANNPSNLISENLYIFEEPELKSLKDAVQEALDVYASDVMGITQRLYVTQSWSLINKPNIGMHAHAHSNSIISGSIYYCELPKPPGNMIFSRHDHYQQLDLAPDRAKRNIYNTPVNTITPEQDDLILFSSRLTHLVETNTTAQMRYSIAFNTFVKGKLGNFRDVSELVL